ncbi:MAG: alkyl hydroperoxide reductase [Acidobacteria bacterium]|nr:alkyl hydroperoxide reductase [Acidobacteriota bacterium]
MSDRPPRWMSRVLYAAGAYNIAWGASVVFAPLLFFRWAHAAPPNYPEIWQCVGMIVGVYGVGYLVAARDPLRHWAVVLVGFLGKLFGPVGFLLSLRGTTYPRALGWINVTNDLVWLVPFAIILYRALEFERRRGRRDELTRE